MNLSDFRVFLRALWRNKLYSLITVGGFAFSLAFVILLSVYIRQELSVDRFHEKKDRIFRAVSERSAMFGPLVGADLKSKYPEIEAFTRMKTHSGYVTDLQHENINLECLLVDSAFFNIFSFPLVEGEASDVLRTKGGIVLTRSCARKLFGTESVVGKEVNFDGEFRLMVTGVMEDMPDNTHIDKCDALLNFEMLPDLWHAPEVLASNDNSSFGLYFLARPGTDLPSKAPQVLDDFKKNYWIYLREYSKVFEFEPVTDAYFGGKDGNGTHGNSQTLVFVLSAIAIVILLLALINYNNLSVAQAGFRAKEAAVKKLLGTNNSGLFRQFITESVVLCLISFLVAIILSYALRPLFNEMLDTHIFLTGSLTAGMILLALGVVVILGVIAGLAPAIMITRFNPVDVVKGAFRRKTRGIYSKVLICFQYTVAIVLIICTLTILKQTDFMRNYNLGFNKENIVWMSNQISSSQQNALRSEFMQLPEVVSVSFVAGSPIDGGNNNSFVYNDKPVSFQVFLVDTAFFDMLNIRITPTGVAQTADGVWLNRTAVRELELGDLPLEFKPYKGGDAMPVMGVTDDFHFRSLAQRVGPAMVVPLSENDGAWSILVKLKGNNPVGSFDELKNVYGKFINDIPFESGFMDETINEWYEQNDRTASLIGYFSVVAIMLAMMGILAMATFFIQQRVKEIGVRRVNGATILEILRMLIFGFMKWIGIAFLLACPIAWYAMSGWLNSFAYRTDMGWWIFACAGLFACVVALLMIGGQSLKAATINPVQSLKNE